MKIVTIVGARPQFVKAAVVSRAISKYPEITEIIIHTGQHYDINMSELFFEEMNIPKPSYQLNINGLRHGAMTGQMLEKIEEILLIEKPDWVLVYGDTNSTLAGALATSKLHIKLAHVEAGLRSFNMKMPEEINRILTDRISTVLFCPTKQAVENLGKEGFKVKGRKGEGAKRLKGKRLKVKGAADVVKTGDVMYDAAMFYSVHGARYTVHGNGDLKILATIHRAENTDSVENLKQIFAALEILADKYGMILPLHPRTKKCLEKINYDFTTSKITFIEPVGYLQMIDLLQSCSLVMTDSGGLQKEAYFFKKPCVTLREETEWVELVEAGCNCLVGSSTEKIIENAEKMLQLSNEFFNKNLYGDGKAGEEIVEYLLAY